MRLTIGLLAALLFSPGSVERAGPPFQTRTITGSVIDSTSTQPVTNGQVTIRGTAVGTSLGSDGSFSIQAPAKEVVLVIQSLGFRRREVTVPPATRHVQVVMVRESLQLEAIVVTEQAVAKASKSLGNATSPMWAAPSPDMLLRSAAMPADPRFNTEQYGHIVEGIYLAADKNPLSTFSIDVDRASYGNMRRFITGGSRPPVDAVRIEELVNYFPYDYPEPSHRHPFSVTTETAAAPWNTAHRLLRIGLKGRSIETRDLPPNNLVFLIDVSGSMHSPDKLPLVQAALSLLVNELRPQDRVALTVYAGAAGLVLPSTTGDRKTEILRAIDALQAGGSTAGAAGIRLAYQVARENHIAGGNNRVILATDGDFNVGVSSDGELIRMIEERRAQGTFLTVLGFGTGNLKDARMEQLADHGNGNYAYIDNLLEARKTLVTEMGGTLRTVAKDVKIQVEFNPARVQGYRLIGYENRMLKAEDFKDDKKDAGEIGAGHTVTALYEIIPVGVAAPELRSVDSLRYQAPTASREVSRSELGFVKLRYKQPDGDTSILLEHPVADAADGPSRDLRFASAVAGFGMLLRDSEYAGSWKLEDVLRTAQGSLGPDTGGYRREFTTLVEKVMKGEMLVKK